MAKLLKLRRGTTSQHSSFTGAEGEVTVDTTKDTLVVHDGSTAAGHPVAAEDMANVSAANIKGRLGTTLTNAEINASAAIAGTKISPDFGSQNITTTGTITTTGILDTGVATVNGVHCTVVTDGSTNNGCFLNAGDTGAGNRPDIVLKGAGSAGLGQKAFEIFYNNGSNLVFDINYQGDVVARHADFGAGIDVTGNITSTGDIRVADDKSVFCGASDDFAMLHRTSDNTSILKETGGGDLSLETNGSKVGIYDNANNRHMAQFITGGACKLNHGATTRLETTSGGATVTGNLAVTGTIPASQLTGALPAIDGSNLTGVTSVGGATGVSFNDNVKARFGTSNDLDIYHDGNHSYIIDNGTGDLKLRGSETIKLEDTSSGKPMITCTKNQGTEIYHQGGSAVATAVVRLATTSTGVTITGHAVPASNNTHDLGTTSNRWRNIYTNDLHLSNEGHSNDVDSSWGSWTIQEGESDLFLKNNRSGKKYKFNLTEVS